MRRVLALTLLMGFIWSGAEGQDPMIFNSNFESGDAAEEWSSVVIGDVDQPPIVKIIAPQSWSCSIYPDKRTCNDQFLCRWDNRNDICVDDH